VRLLKSVAISFRKMPYASQILMFSQIIVRRASHTTASRRLGLAGSRYA
jgi:hypothetical protein